jgi:hypothetical protein
MKPRLFALSSPSFALISVLALVSLAALTATAFLASARLDRQATRSLGETARLEMACTSARECASQTLNIMCEPKWQTIATYWRGTNSTDWTNELGYLLLGRPNSAANIRWTYFCGFNPASHKKLDTNVFLIEGTNTKAGSYLTEIGSFMATMTNGFVTNPTSTNTNCTLIPLLGGRTSPPVGWTYIYQAKKMANSTNTTNVPVARFSYYMEDLSGLIDAERMGGTNRTTGTNASEISLTNLTTNWSSASILSASNYTKFINPTNRAKYFSPGLMLYAGGLSTNDLRYFAHGLLSWTNFPNTIPVGIPITSSTGYGKGDNNTLKVNLNSSANLNVSTLAAAINGNLSGFTNRAGGMSATAYVNNLAANIVDYLDTDDAPTTDSATSPTYVGVENIPWPNELFDTLQFANVIWSKNMVVVDVKDQVEVWNMGNKPIPASTSANSALSISNSYDLVLTFTNTYLGVSQKVNLKDMVTQDAGTVWPRYRVYSNPVIPPNGYAVLSAWKRSADNYTHTTLGATLPATWFPNTNAAGRSLISSSWYVFPAQADATSNMKYIATYNGKAIQQSKGGRWTRYLAPSFKMANNNLGLSPSQYVFLNPIGYASQTTISGTPTHSGGDPRAQYFLSGALRNHNYVNQYASPGGRNVERYNISSFPESEVNPAKFWPDGGHATNNEWGGNPTQYSDDPSSYTTTAQTNNWVMSCRPTNQTGLLSVTELGRIYDPMQWSDQAGSGVSAQPGLWTNLTASATASTLYGGRTTLRIGRPEFSRFAFTNLGGTYPVPNMGLSSAALLDIFSTSDSYDTGGRINLNTAPAPVLRALAGGVTLTNDSAMKPSSALAVPTKMTEAFAQGVMRYRAMYPFLSPSQLAFIATDYGITNSASTHWTNTWPKNAVFGNTNASILLTNAPGNTLGTTASMGISEWNDQAAEEWFSKLYNLSTVQSWNYRTYVVAQLVGTNGLPTGPSMRKYSLMYVRYSGSFPTISAGPFISFESPY